MKGSLAKNSSIVEMLLACQLPLRFSRWHRCEAADDDDDDDCDDDDDDDADADVDADDDDLGDDDEDD